MPACVIPGGSPLAKVWRPRGRRVMLSPVLRFVFTLAGLLALLLGGAWLVTMPPPVAPPELARPEAARAPPGSPIAGLHTPFGDALFRWRCTTGLRDALGSRTGWPLERLAGLCLCIAERMREQGLADVPRFGGGDASAALEAAEASLCRPR